MVLIFGFGQGKGQDLGEVAPIACPNCHNDVFLHHVHSEKSFKLYFVPVATYGSNEYLVCPICTRAIQLSEAQRSTVAGMRAATVAHRLGEVPEDLYRVEVEQFWVRMGIAPHPTAAGTMVVPRASETGAVSPPLAIPGRSLGLAPASLPPTVPAAGSAPLADELAGLAELHRAGVLTDEEFTAAKDRVLRR